MYRPAEYWYSEYIGGDVNSSFLKDNIATTPSRWLKCTPVWRQEPEFHNLMSSLKGLGFEIRCQHCLFGLSFWYQPYAAWALPRKGWVYNDWHLVSAGPWGFPSVSAVKNPPAMQETQEMWVRSLDWEDPLEESMATHSSILAWRIPWMEEPGGLQSMG